MLLGEVATFGSECEQLILAALHRKLTRGTDQEGSKWVWKQGWVAQNV